MVDARLAGASLLGILVSPPLVGRYATKYQMVKYRNEPSAAALEDLTKGNRVGVAYVGYNTPYLFFGRRLQHSLTEVPRSGPPGSQYFDWGDDEYFPFEGDNFATWRRNLDSLRIEFVVVVRSGYDRPERPWMKRRPDQFKIEYSEADVEIWRVLKVPAPVAALVPNVARSRVTGPQLQP